MSIEKKKPLKKTIEIFYKPDTLYAITIAPNDQNQFLKKDITHRTFCDTKCRIDMVYKHLKRKLYKYEGSLNFLLHLDISEPKVINKNLPRLHWHGIFSFNNNEDILYWLLEILPDLHLIGIIDIDSIDDIKHWEKYCKKYDHITNVIPIKNNLEWP